MITTIANRPLKLLTLVMPALLGAEMCAPADGSPELGTLLKMRELLVAIAEFEVSYERFPNTLDELCTDPESCSFSLNDEQFLDAWGNRLGYNLAKGQYELRSTGQDGAPYTPDDLILSPAQETRQLASASGCYLVALPLWESFPGDRLVLDTTQVHPGLYRASPSIGGRDGRWWPMGGDSLMVTWAHGPQVTDAVLHHTDTTLAGFWKASSEGFSSTDRHVTASRVPC